MADDNTKQPLLSPAGDDHVVGLADDEFLLRPSLASFRSSFVPDPDDIPPITGARDFFREFRVESRKLWYLAGPAVFTSICQYSLGAITQTFAGHLSTIDLAAVTVENSVIAGFSFGVMLKSHFGNGECVRDAMRAGVWGGANRHARSVYAAVVGDSERHGGDIDGAVRGGGAVSAADRTDGGDIGGGGEDGAVHDPAAVRVRHEFPHRQIPAGAEQDDGDGLIYIFSGACGQAWSGFSPKAFQNLWSFVRLSLASAVMLCLETWYFMALVLFAGYLKNAEVAVDALSICVRVSNELGAGHPRTAKFSVVVVVMSSFVLGVLISAVLLIFRRQYPALFADDEVVKALVYNLTPLLATCIVVSNIQPTLSGVAIGGGWQALVAYVNIACYYLLGIPAGLIMGYVLNMGLEGIWYGMLGGTVASIAADRIKQWAGEPEIKEVD
nr:protein DETOXIFICATION 29-like [Ipomoea batatas]